ncbi:alpha/beta hydrolase [Niveispirillum sp. BGYR6]|uniref:lipase family alpha/beta hydrolase n=1 Tax=Niveispirillum sp. BGYR6 TaxID=2971249 RepID=UPI0022B958AB|nr:alpha/beta hydrolase [Niveispirillum sp. BGYR6]MDG5496739.1 alpha/beta hydrolase [Niveispirillum sp. BGYR6]
MANTYHAIIILPGTTGTSLVINQSDEASTSPLWTTQALKEAALPASAAIVAGEMSESLYAGMPAGFDTTNSGYGALINSIVTAANASNPNSYSFQYAYWPTNTPPNMPENALPWLNSDLTGNTVIGWGYDWRQDNLLVSAQMLQNFLNYLVNSQNVGKITLIGHSMGGLVARSYLESVGKSDNTIIGMIDQLITLGTPHLGAPMALAPISNTMSTSVAGDDSLNPFIQIFDDWLAGLEQIAADNVLAMFHAFVNGSMGVSTYQLLPPNLSSDTLSNFITYSGPKVTTESYPIYPFANLPTPVQKRLNNTNFNSTNLAAAEKLFSNLNYTSAPPVPYHCIYGVVSTTEPSATTAATGTITGFTAAPGELFDTVLTPVWTDGGGDTIVPIYSAMFSTNSNVTTYGVNGADHIHMPSNAGVQSQVNALLGFSAS